jgi:hypothetical protein
MSLLEALPLAFVMIAGPQIITSFFLATSQRFAANSGAYVVGAAIPVIAYVTVAYFLGHGASAQKRTPHTVFDWVLLALLVAVMVHVYLTRKQSQPPEVDEQAPTG